MNRENRKMVIWGAAVLCVVWLSGCSSPLEGPGVKPEAPGAPVLKTGKASFHVQWEETSLAETYQVYLSLDETPAAVPIKTGVIGHSVTLEGLMNETTYYVWVQAVNGMGKSPLSDVTKKTLTLEPPVITGLTAGSGSMTVIWDAFGMADSYNVYYDTSATLPASPYQSDITGNSVTISGLINDTTYYVWVESVNSGGAKVSEAASITLGLQAPQPVLTPEIGSSIIVAWEPATFADSYNVYCAVSAILPVNPYQSDITGNSVTISGLISETAYYVWVEAVNLGGTKISEAVSGVSGPSSQDYTVYSENDFIQAVAGINASSATKYYRVILYNNITASNISFSATSVEKIIIIKGDTALRTISNANYYDLFTINMGNLVLENNVKLNGNNQPYNAVQINSGGTLIMKTGSLIEGTKDSAVRVNGGAFTMEGGSISGNMATEGGGVYISSGTFTMSGGTISGNTFTYNGGGGGVEVRGGTFTMSGGTISGNKAYSNGSGGGVQVSGGTFTMSGGTISGNTASLGGGGVEVRGGTFTMSGGTISGNTANSIGGGVDVSGGTFTKSGGGTISNTNTASRGRVAYVWDPKKQRNSTAGPEVYMDSTVNGSAGGWE